MRRSGFEGWYFKHQKGDEVIAFIPGRADSGAFVQVLSSGGSKQFDVPRLTEECGIIKAGDCIFSKYGCKVNLPGISGEIIYDDLTPLKSDIMGPFQYLPMQCRHGVISMAHSLHGGITVDGMLRSFDGGTGYIERDSGRSFPKAYMWLQCNRFAEPCAVMFSAAHIPLPGAAFEGCICAIIYRGHEYRFATYSGVRIHAMEPDYICISQGSLLMTMDITPTDGHALRSPQKGVMSGTVRESVNVRVRLRLWEKRNRVIDLESRYAMYEYVPEPTANTY